jgi:hypothetical protein
MQVVGCCRHVACSYAHAYLGSQRWTPTVPLLQQQGLLVVLLGSHSTPLMQLVGVEMWIAAAASS